MALKVATAEDVLKYPELALVEGQEFEVPEALTDEEDDDENQDDTGGNHPPVPGKP